MKVKTTAYKGFIVIETFEPEKEIDGWVPAGPGKIGYVICDTAKHLGASEEALALLEQVERGHDDLGDIDWWACDDETKAFSWIGGLYKIARADEVEGGRNYTVFRDACTIISNDTPEAAKQVIDHMVSSDVTYKCPDMETR